MKFFKKIFKSYFAVLFFLVVFLSGYILGSFGNNTANKASDIISRPAPENLSQEIDFDLFWKTWDTIKQKYVVQPVDEKILFYGALKGLVESLDDPYSVFLTPQETKELNEELKGTFEGIGAEIGIKDSILTIISPLSSSPAEKAGLKPKDKIVKINDEETRDMSLDTAVAKIRGPKGTTVVLTVLREGEDELREISIVRNTIKIETVKWELIENNLAYIKISHFNIDTLTSLNELIPDVLKSSPDGIILDLRGNPGGFLDVSVDVAGKWIGKNTAVIEEDAGKVRQEIKSRSEAVFDSFPTVVLINEGSASASEIVAGALRDWGKATLVGTKTFGKGSVQELDDIGISSSIKLTVAKWLTPNGQYINDTGIEPDVSVELTLDDYNNDRDPQLNKATELLTQN